MHDSGARSLEIEPLEYVPDKLRWSPFDIDPSVNWVDGLRHIGRAGSPAMKNEMGYYVFTAGKDMAENTVFYSADGDFLIVLQTGSLDTETELVAFSNSDIRR